MSINPVQGIGPAQEPRIAAANPRVGQAEPTAAAPSPQGPGSGTEPSRETRSPQIASPQSEMPQDDVQVQRDSQTREIVIRYLDRNGNVVLQIPSSQMLGVSRAIEQALQEEAKARTEAGSEGGKAHGN